MAVAPSRNISGLVFLDEVSYHRSISLVLVVLQPGVIYDIDLAGPVRHELRRQVLNAAAYEHADQPTPRLPGQLRPLAQEFQADPG